MRKRRRRNGTAPPSPLERAQQAALRLIEDARLNLSPPVPRPQTAAPPSLVASRNQQPQHPPFYYVTLAAAWRLVRAAVPGDALTSYDRQVWVLRALSALFLKNATAIFTNCSRLPNPSGAN